MGTPTKFRIPVEGQALALFHLLAEKNLISIAEDRNLEEFKGEVSISSDPSDKSVTLFFNPGPGVVFAHHFFNIFRGEDGDEGNEGDDGNQGDQGDQGDDQGRKGR